MQEMVGRKLVWEKPHLSKISVQCGAMEGTTSFKMEVIKLTCEGGALGGVGGRKDHRAANRPVGSTTTTGGSLIISLTHTWEEVAPFQGSILGILSVRCGLDGIQPAIHPSEENSGGVIILLSKEGMVLNGGRSYRVKY